MPGSSKNGERTAKRRSYDPAGYVVPEPTAADLAVGKDDDTGQKESQYLSEGKDLEQLRAEADRREHARTEDFKDHFERIAIAALYLVSVSMAVVIAVWLWHILTPYAFLSEAQIETIQTLVTGGAVASFAVGHLKRRLGGGDDK